MLTALLDTNVIWPNLRRDFLLSLAIENAYWPLWSHSILEELEYHENRKHEQRGMAATLARSRAHNLIRTMRAVFPDAIVTGWEHLEGTYGLPDPDDEHVLAAAVTGGADVIVTENLKDFPTRALPSDISVMGAAQFAHTIVTDNPHAALRALHAMSTRFTHPPFTPAQLIDDLENRYRMHEAADIMRQHLHT